MYTKSPTAGFSSIGRLLTSPSTLNIPATAVVFDKGRLYRQCGEREGKDRESYNLCAISLLIVVLCAL